MPEYIWNKIYKMYRMIYDNVFGDFRSPFFPTLINVGSDSHTYTYILSSSLSISVVAKSTDETPTI